MPVALSAQAESPRRPLSTSVRSHRGLTGFHLASSFPARIDSSLNPLFAELGSEEPESRSAGPQQSLSAPLLCANPLYNESAKSASTAAEPQRTLPSCYIDNLTGTQTAQTTGIQTSSKETFALHGDCQNPESQEDEEYFPVALGWSEAEQPEDTLLAERLSSHYMAGPSRSQEGGAGVGLSAAVVGLKSAALDLAVDSPDPMGMGIIDARTCTLRADVGTIRLGRHASILAGRLYSFSQAVSRQRSCVVPLTKIARVRQRLRGEGRNTHFRLLQAQILPGSEAFEPVVYLGRIHLTSGIGKLKQGKDLLKKQIERQQLSVQQLVKEHFGRIARCQETVVSAAAYMSRTELARREHVSTQSTLAHVSQAHTEYSMAVSPMIDHQRAFQRATGCLAAILHHAQILNGPARVQQAILQQSFQRVPLEYSQTLNAMEWQPMTPELRERLVALLCKAMSAAADAAQKHIAEADLVSLTAEEALYALIFIADQDILDVALENPVQSYARAKVALLTGLIKAQINAQHVLLRNAFSAVHSTEFLQAQSAMQVDALAAAFLKACQAWHRSCKRIAGTIGRACPSLVQAAAVLPCFKGSAGSNTSLCKGTSLPVHSYDAAVSDFIESAICCPAAIYSLEDCCPCDVNGSYPQPAVDPFASDQTTATSLGMAAWGECSNLPKRWYQALLAVFHPLQELNIYKPSLISPYAQRLRLELHSSCRALENISRHAWMQNMSSQEQQANPEERQLAPSWWSVVAANNCVFIGNHLLPKIVEAYSELFRADGLEQAALNKEKDELATSLQLAADDLLSSYIINQAQAVEAAAAVCPAHQELWLHHEPLRLELSSEYAEFFTILAKVCGEVSTLAPPASAAQVMAALVKRAAYAWYKGCETALPALQLPYLLQLGAEACLMERILSQLIRQPADKLFKAVRHHVANHVGLALARSAEGSDAALGMLSAMGLTPSSRGWVEAFGQLLAPEALRRAASWANAFLMVLPAPGGDVRKGGPSTLHVPISSTEVHESATMKGGSSRRLTAKSSNSMFSCSAAKQYERLDHLASARKSVIEADIVAHLQQATLGHTMSLQIGVEQKESPSGPSGSMDTSSQARRLVQADPAAKGSEASDVDVLAVAWPVLSFRPTPRSKQTPAKEANKQAASSDLQSAQLTPPASQSLGPKAVARADAATVTSSDDDDWSYPALDLTASKDEAAQRMQAMAAEEQALEYQSRAQDSVEGDLQPGSASAVGHADLDPNDSSDHEDWSYPAMQPVVPTQRPQVTMQSDSHNPSKTSAISTLEAAFKPDEAACNATTPEAWVHAASSTSAPIVQPQLASVMQHKSSFTAELPHMMYSNAAYNSARPSTSSEEDGVSQQGTPATIWQPDGSLASPDPAQLAPFWTAYPSESTQCTGSDSFPFSPIDAAADKLQSLTLPGFPELSASADANASDTQLHLHVSNEHPIPMQQTAVLSRLALLHLPDGLVAYGSNGNFITSSHEAECRF
ncbi:hypothetical protein WJX74_010572 [Apatococcus lobatus]|uniref:Exocyst complex component EXOC2/Sec5 N-terminal domain-containing protein n=1 Tax=Apatococcus lobatus TaxID=904363 RepID=A0AAW1RRU6_9CHLO